MKILFVYEGTVLSFVELFEKIQRELPRSKIEFLVADNYAQAEVLFKANSKSVDLVCCFDPQSEQSFFCLYGQVIKEQPDIEVFIFTDNGILSRQCREYGVNASFPPFEIYDVLPAEIEYFLERHI